MSGPRGAGKAVERAGENRQSVTGERVVVAHVKGPHGLRGAVRLESLTGLPGFPARAICQVNEPQFAARSLRSDSEWHQSPVEKDWYWKGETSSDEIVGHYLAWYLFCELVADEDQKRQVRATCQRVTDHILNHRYYLVDQDGDPTTVTLIRQALLHTGRRLARGMSPAEAGLSCH